MLNTLACIESERKTLIGRDPESTRIIARLNSVNDLFCDITKRIKSSRHELLKYCATPSSLSISSSSSSSLSCPVSYPTKVPKYLYQISVNDLDTTVYDNIIALERRGCVILRKLIDFEKVVTIQCNSSSASPSSAVPAPSPGSGIILNSYTSSSSLKSLSSTPVSPPSASVSAPPVCPSPVFISSFCPSYELSSQLYPYVLNSVDYGPCAYKKSNDLSTSSSAPSALGEVFLKFNLIQSRWEISTVAIGVIAIKLGSSYNPKGTYTFQSGPCAGQSIFVV